MSKDDHEHHEVIPNPDYDGPGQHCLPPPVREGVDLAIVFAILMGALAIGAAFLGIELLMP
jgi:hypothetical protein